MKIQLTFEFDDRERRALATHYGQTGKLSRREIVLWLEGLVRSTLEGIVSEAEEEEQEGDDYSWASYT